MWKLCKGLFFLNKPIFYTVLYCSKAAEKQMEKLCTSSTFFVNAKSLTKPKNNGRKKVEKMCIAHVEMWIICEKKQACIFNHISLRISAIISRISCSRIGDSAIFCSTTVMEERMVVWSRFSIFPMEGRERSVTCRTI